MLHFLKNKRLACGLVSLGFCVSFYFLKQGAFYIFKSKILDTLTIYKHMGYFYVFVMFTIHMR